MQCVILFVISCWFCHEVSIDVASFTSLMSDVHFEEHLNIGRIMVTIPAGL
ncbi:hypothetical protein HNQ64_001021 [Prosthecobacter dejongeii]|uniref:Uncharacterized protein n=1 Tax=Prosthecobacter dejongeii TaxID=48465 RepID=A0A7W7YIQ8_9BACT|nr:hypothetical protein [Prosthecobacter dejongeii]